MDGEAVLAVEQAGDEETAEPAQLAARVGLQDLGAEGGRPAAGGRILSSRRLPGTAWPVAWTMNGFHWW